MQRVHYRLGKQNTFYLEFQILSAVYDSLYKLTIESVDIAQSYKVIAAGLSKFIFSNAIRPY